MKCFACGSENYQKDQERGLTICLSCGLPREHPDFWKTMKCDFCGKDFSSDKIAHANFKEGIRNACSDCYMERKEEVEEVKEHLHEMEIDRIIEEAECRPIEVI